LPKFIRGSSFHFSFKVKGIFLRVKETVFFQSEKNLSERYQNDFNRVTMSTT
jgi:hypothetical protein